MCVCVCVCVCVQGFIQRGGKLGFPPPQEFEKLYIEKSVQIVNDDKYKLCELFMTGTKFTD